MNASARETPSAAFGLSIAGGLLIILAGLLVAAIGALITLPLAGLGGLFGLAGVLWGVLIIVCAIMLRSSPERHVGLGIAIILLALFSWVGSFGGFVIGFLLALVGGILAIIWRPGGASVNISVSTAPVPTTTLGRSRFCTNCGSPVEAGTNFCRNCGKPL